MIILCSCFYFCRINPEHLHLLSIKNLFIAKGHLSSVTYIVSFLLCRGKTDFILKELLRIKTFSNSLKVTIFPFKLY